MREFNLYNDIRPVIAKTTSVINSFAKIYTK